MNPKVTVLMPVYNGGKYLRKAIESVLNQTFTDFEFLIINDGSTDQSKEIILSYKDNRLRYVENEKNLGLIATLNKGLTLAAGEYIARMDCDDVSMPERLQAQVDFMDTHPEYVLVGIAADVIDEQGSVLYPYIAFAEDGVLRAALAVHNQFTHGSVMVRKDAALLVGGYSEQAYLVEDYDLWIKLSKIGKLENLTQVLYQWRTNPAGECSKNPEVQINAEKQIATDYWVSFGKQGPAAPETWKQIAWEKTVDKQTNKIIKKRLAKLHVNLAKEYVRRGNYAHAGYHVGQMAKKAGEFFNSFF